MRQDGFLWWNIRDPRFAQRSAAVGYYDFLGHPGALAYGGMPGQNDTTTPSIFHLHPVLEIAGVLYDASYGKTFTSLQDFQDTMIDGFMKGFLAEEVHFGYDANENGVYNERDGVDMFVFRHPAAGQLQVKFWSPP